MATGLGYVSLLRDIGVATQLRMWTDSTASKGICSRQGLGKVRHLDIQRCWVQQRVRRGEVALYKVLGDDNLADVVTRAGTPALRMGRMMEAMGCEYRKEERIQHRRLEEVLLQSHTAHGLQRLPFHGHLLQRKDLREKVWRPLRHRWPGCSGALEYERGGHVQC